MGRKYSPAYADIYLADWEESASLKCPSRPLLYYRYLDDIFGLWDKSETEFNHFIHILNSHHPGIALKHTLPLQQVPFLDTIVFFSEIIDGYKTLGTKVYFRVRVRDISALLRTSLQSLQSPGTTPGFGFAQTTPHRDVSATPPAVATTTPLGSAHARLALEFPADGVIPVTPTRRPTRHVNTAHKEIEWSLRARERHIIIGDSNLSRFPPFQHPSLQVDSFPGATFAHAASILAKTTITPDVHKVV